MVVVEADKSRVVGVDKAREVVVRVVEVFVVDVTKEVVVDVVDEVVVVFGRRRCIVEVGASVEVVEVETVEVDSGTDSTVNSPTVTVALFPAASVTVMFKM